MSVVLTIRKRRQRDRLMAGLLDLVALAVVMAYGLMAFYIAIQ